MARYFLPESEQESNHSVKFFFTWARARLKLLGLFYISTRDLTRVKLLGIFFTLDLTRVKQLGWFFYLWPNKSPTVVPVFFTRVINISIEMPGMLICFILSTFFYPVLVVNCILGVVQVRQSIQRFPRNLLQIIRLIHLLDSPKKFRKLYCYRSSSTFFIQSRNVRQTA